MKFEDFYNQVFIAEKDEDVQNKVASPDDVDVEPLPLPTPAPTTPDTDSGDTSVPTPAPKTGGGTISDYVLKIQDFAESLNSPDKDCLNKLVKRLDQPNTPYDGIAARTSTDIVRVAEGLRGIAENLINFALAAEAGKTS
jgi:hypothetical protein